MSDATDLLEAHPLGEGDWIAVAELCRLCRMDVTVLAELAELGVIAPRGYSPEEWQFPATALPLLRTAGRLMHDLGVNVCGAALAVELLERQRELERRVRRLERLAHE
ncbi:MAG: MerR family transcriptional regulator [Gammaproteobacteria bacterium]|nr:MAG: MerR family transcriptional regulator [Gammaproteobacteria bacterium]